MELIHQPVVPAIGEHPVAIGGERSEVSRPLQHLCQGRESLLRISRIRQGAHAQPERLHLLPEPARGVRHQAGRPLQGQACGGIEPEHARTAFGIGEGAVGQECHSGAGEFLQHPGAGQRRTEHAHAWVGSSPLQQIPLSGLGRRAAAGMKTPLRLLQRLRQNSAIEHLLQHGQGEITTLVGLALTPVQEQLQGRLLRGETRLERKLPGSTEQAGMQLRRRQSSSGAEGCIALDQQLRAGAEQQLVAGLGGGPGQGGDGGAGIELGRLALDVQAVTGLAGEHLSRRKHQADQNTGRRLVLQQPRQGDQLKRQQTVGQPDVHRRTRHSLLQRRTEQGRLMEAAGEIAPMSRIDITGVAEQGAQCRCVIPQPWIIGGGAIRPDLHTPAMGLQQGQQCSVQISMVAHRMAEAWIEEHESGGVAAVHQKRTGTWASPQNAPGMNNAGEANGMEQAGVPMATAVSPLALMEALAAELPESWVKAALARRRRELERLQEAEQASAEWRAITALQLAHLWLVAGLPGRGDDLILEAHRLLPEAGLIPDWWGLWPAAHAASGPSEARNLATSYIQLRHLPPLAAWRAWLAAVNSERRRSGEPALQLLLGLVIHGRDRLPGPLEPALEQLLGEELVAAEPALAWRLLDPLCERLPHWSYARLKAADLSLQRGELERCEQHLNRASAEQWQLPWLHDIAARHALAKGELLQALTSWQTAIARCEGEADAEIFRQRAREARRGPGVLQARSLLNQGNRGAAVALLEPLLEQDPQWQPLRRLLEQAQEAPTPTPEAPAASGGDLARLERRLQQLAERAGLNWPPAELPPPRDAAAAERFVQEALGRLALLG